MTGDDHARLGDDAEELVAWIDNAAYMRLEPVTAGLHRCIALTIDAHSGIMACSIYDRRPNVCRELARGGGACRGEIETKKERPKRALVVLRAAPR